MFLNPFYLFAIIWGTTLVLYTLGISELFPNLTKELMIFIIFSIIFSIIVGKIFSRKLKIRNNLKKINKNFAMLYIFIYIAFAVDFIYEGKIPLIETLKKTGYMYTDFKGIPTFHVLLFTYNFYITLCTFYNYCLTKKSKYLFYTILGVVPYMLLYLRGSTLLLIISFFLIILYFRYKLKVIIKVGIVFVMVLYIFGIAGNKRHNYSWNDSSMIKRIACINMNKSILDPFLWGYVYLVSPLGNLQYNFNESTPKKNIKTYIYENFFLDAVSKRLDYQTTSTKLMIPHLTVSSFYIKPYLGYGKIGMIVVLCSYMLFEIICLRVVRGTAYWTLTLIIINVLNIFSVFSNMFVFTGFSFILVYALVDGIKNKMKGEKRNERNNISGRKWNKTLSDNKSSFKTDKSHI